MDAVLRFVEAGLGVALVPSMVLDGRPGLAGTPLAPPGLRRTIALAHRKDVEPTRAAQAFRATLLASSPKPARRQPSPRGGADRRMSTDDAPISPEKRRRVTANSIETLTLLLIEDDAGDAFLVEELLSEAEAPPKIIWVRSMAREPGAKLHRGRPVRAGRPLAARRDRPGGAGAGAGDGPARRRARADRPATTPTSAWRPSPPAPRTTWSSRTSTPDCWRGRSATRWSASAPTWPSAGWSRPSCSPRRTPAWNAGCCRSRCCAPGVLEHHARYLPGRRRALLGR